MIDWKIVSSDERGQFKKIRINRNVIEVGFRESTINLTSKLSDILGEKIIVGHPLFAKLRAYETSNYPMSKGYSYSEIMEAITRAIKEFNIIEDKSQSKVSIATSDYNKDDFNY